MRATSCILHLLPLAVLWAALVAPALALEPMQTSTCVWNSTVSVTTSGSACNSNVHAAVRDAVAASLRAAYPGQRIRVFKAGCRATQASDQLELHGAIAFTVALLTHAIDDSLTTCYYHMYHNKQYTPCSFA